MVDIKTILKENKVFWFERNMCLTRDEILEDHFRKTSMNPTTLPPSPLESIQIPSPNELFETRSKNVDGEVYHLLQKVIAQLKNGTKEKPIASVSIKGSTELAVERTSQLLRQKGWKVTYDKGYDQRDGSSWHTMTVME